VPSAPAPPTARRDDVHETLHGVDIVDPYRWLEDQSAPETRAWIDAQNAYTHALLDGSPDLGAIRMRLTELSRVDSQRLPSVHGKHVFSWRRGASDDLWIYSMRDGLSG
jgi:prolyl oligopeptidase